MRAWCSVVSHKDDLPGSLPGHTTNDQSIQNLDICRYTTNQKEIK